MPMVGADRVEDELPARVVELGRHEALRPLLGEIAADDGKRLLGGRRPVDLNDGALDSDVLIRKRLLLDAEADDARLLDQLGLARPVALGPGEKAVVNTTPSDSLSLGMVRGTSRNRQRWRRIRRPGTFLNLGYRQHRSSRPVGHSSLKINDARSHRDASQV